jgi:hypothetical protein
MFAPSPGKIKAHEPREMLLDNDGLIRYMLRLGQAHMIRQSVRMLKKIRRDAVLVGGSREAIDGEVTFGNTSLSFEWIEQHAEGWNMVGIRP